jgi:hypothetical protein
MAARYFDAIRWIAFNDDPALGTSDSKAIEQMMTVALVADLFGKPVRVVATDVIRCRAYNAPDNTFPIPKKYQVSA